MQSSSSMPGMPFPENISLREGQKKTVDLVSSGQPLVVTQLPTGYGKTLTAVCAYAALRQQGKVNRLLYVCPRRNQASQAAEIPTDLKEIFSINTRSINIGEEPIVSIRRHRENTGEIFIVTIQSLTYTNGAFKIVKDLMQTGKWMIVVDEHHHYSDGERWSDALRSLSYESMLAMSATPNATGDDHFPKPDVVIPYRIAHAEKAVKTLELHEYEYVVDVVCDDDVITFTTGELFSELGSSPDDIDDEMVKRKMRWSPKYISPLITIPAERMVNHRLQGIRTQMIVQAMSCSHAGMVCQQVKTLLPSLSVDWVGTGPNGRSDKDNKAILHKFCPPKVNGVRNWELDVLVNVGMAGEGLDTVDVTEIVILTPANIHNTLKQLIGRASRIMLCGNNKAYINVDTDSELGQGEFTGKKIMNIFDSELSAEDEDWQQDNNGEKDSDDYIEIPDEPFVYITDVRLVDIRTDPTYEDAMDALRVADSGHRTDDELHNIAEDAIRKHNRDRDEMLTAESTLAQLKQATDLAAGKVAGLVLRQMFATGMRMSGSQPGDIKRRINSRKKQLFGKVDDCDEDGRRRHYKWVKELEGEILRTGVPQWLR